MVYLLGSNLSNEKLLNVALTSIYGIGFKQSNVICNKLGVTKRIKVSDLSKKQINKLKNIIKKSDIIVEGDLKRFILNRKDHLYNIRAYKGIRLKQGFPIRGQRTHTNAKTAKKRL